MFASWNPLQPEITDLIVQHDSRPLGRMEVTLRLVPSNDIQSVKSVFLLGPLTVIRPLLMIRGFLDDYS